VPTTDLMNALKISAVTFQPQWRQEFTRQAGGNPRVADIGPEVWTAVITAGIMNNDDAVDAAAIVNQLRGSLNTFYVWDVRRQYPRLDPTGSILGASSVVIHAMADASHIQLGGLPVGYVLKRGDKFCFDFGSPAHRAFHELCADATADGSGILPSTEVVPSIRTGASNGLTVTLKQPAAEMMIQPGSYSFATPGQGGGVTTAQITLTAIQVP